MTFKVEPTSQQPSLNLNLTIGHLDSWHKLENGAGVTYYWQRAAYENAPLPPPLQQRQNANNATAVYGTKKHSKSRFLGAHWPHSSAPLSGSPVIWSVSKGTAAIALCLSEKRDTSTSTKSKMRKLTSQ